MSADFPIPDDLPPIEDLPLPQDGPVPDLAPAPEITPEGQVIQIETEPDVIVEETYAMPFLIYWSSMLGYTILIWIMQYWAYNAELGKTSIASSNT